MNSKFELPENTKKWALIGLGVGGAALAAYYIFNKETKAVVKRTTDNDVWRRSYDLSTAQLRAIISNFHTEMQNGLQAKPSSLKMLPSYVGKPKGTESGDFLALDLGGTNFRVIRLKLNNGGIGESQKQQYTIPQTAMRGTHEELFDFIAVCVKEFINSQKLNDVRVPMGFTFSFPVNQTGVASGTLIRWTKGFTTTGVEGADVVQLLNQSFARNNVNADIVALANDTVGTMVARSYIDSKCEVGVILGTGTNACYIEEVKNITKFQDQTKLSSMIINMEWGGFGDKTNYLPLTAEDIALDAASLNPSQQLFEKMISGMYLGEIVRYVLLNITSQGQLAGTSSMELLKNPYKFETAYVASIISDQSYDMEDVKTLLEEKLAIVTTLPDRKLIQEVCKAVSTRAARLSAAAIVAVLSKIGRLQDTTVAVDGGVFEHMPGFANEMEKCMKELYPESSIKLVLSKDGSGNGAAIIAATETGR